METLFEPTTISTIVAGIIALILAIGNVIQEYQKKDKDKTIAAGETAIESGASLLKNVIKLFSSDVPMDKEQEALITDGIVPARTWKMSDEIYAQLYKQLVAGGAAVNERGLRATIDLMESKGIVEYGIIVEDHDGDVDTTCDSAFISYGMFVLMSANSVYAACNRAAGAPITAISN